jgi:hypothetical protein
MGSMVARFFHDGNELCLAGGAPADKRVARYPWLGTPIVYTRETGGTNQDNERRCTTLRRNVAQLGLRATMQL